MYLLAESGSTKTDWREFDGEKNLTKFRTSGINPDIQPEELIEAQLREGLTNNLYYRSPKKVYFYGAGLAGVHNRLVIDRILKRVFPNAAIFVYHDLLACARATCFDQPGIACILGTGSNSCYYDGQRIVRQIGGQGFIFGDEGSGADLGKKLMKLALHAQLPEDLIQTLEQWIGLPVLEIRKEIYQADRPNVYLARLSKFIHQHLDRPALKAIAHERFEKFLRRTVERYERHKEVPVYFVGSIAYFYQDILLKECEKKGLIVGKIDKAPIEELVRYHMTHGDGIIEEESDQMTVSR